MGFKDLFSKICAGGLSAGVFLIWWPAHVAGEGLGPLVLRGLLWTLTFELLLCAFIPLERLVIRSVRRRVGERQLSLRDRLHAAPDRARAGGAIALACVGAGTPILLLSDSGAPVRDAEAKPQVVKQVIVKRPVVKREVVVKRTAVPTVPAAAPAAQPAPKPVVRRVLVERVKRVPVPVKTAAPAPTPAAPAEATATTPEAATPAAATSERVTGESQPSS